MIKNIFKKDGTGNYIIDYDNVDIEYYRLVIADTRNTLENLLFILTEYDFEVENQADLLLEELKTKRMIESKVLIRSIENRKSRIKDIINKLLKRYNPKLKTEDSEESYLVVLDELEKVVEHKALGDLIGKGEITEEDKALVDEKRKDIEDILNVCENADAFFWQREDLIKFILSNKDFDRKIGEKKNKTGKKYSFDFNYDTLKKICSVEDISKIRSVFSKYMKKYGVSIEKACDEILAISKLDCIKSDIDKEREIFRLIYEKEAEYKNDLEQREILEKKEEERKKTEEERKLEEKRKKEEEDKKRTEEEQKKNQKEKVKPLLISIWNLNGKKITEQFSKQFLNELFDVIKNAESSSDEKIVFIILSDCSKEEALRVLNEFREEARNGGVKDNRIEGILSEWGKEFIIDENTVIPLISDTSVRKDIEKFAKDSKKNFPKLQRKDKEKSFLTYSLDAFKDTPDEIDDIIEQNKKDGKREITLLKDKNNSVMYGIPRINFLVVGRYLLDIYFKKKYKVSGTVIRTFMDWKKEKIEKENSNNDKEVDEEQK